MRGRRILIVGATGVLRPAVDSYLAAGATVVAVARNRERLALLVPAGSTGLLPLSLDVLDPYAVAAAVVSAPLCDGVDAAILYVAGSDDESENAAVSSLSAAVRGTTVRILTSRWTPPHAPGLTRSRWPAARGRVHLLLGRQTGSAQSGGGWHTPEQISAAAVAALAGGVDAVLGEPVRPPGP